MNWLYWLPIVMGALLLLSYKVWQEHERRYAEAYRVAEVSTQLEQHVELERSENHLGRLKMAIDALGCDAATEVVVRRLDKTLAPDSVFWGEDDGGEHFIEWGGVKPGAPENEQCRHTVRIYYLP